MLGHATQSRSGIVTIVPIQRVLPAWRRTVANSRNELDSLHLPMLGHAADPGDAGVAEGGGGLESAGDGLGDDREALLLEFLQQFLLPRDQSVDLPRLPVKKRGDLLLFVLRWQRQVEVFVFLCAEVLDRGLNQRGINARPIVACLKVVVRKARKNYVFVRAESNQVTGVGSPPPTRQVLEAFADGSSAAS